MNFQPSVVKNNLYIILSIFVGFISGIIFLYTYSHSFEAFITFFSLFVIIYSSISITYILNKSSCFNEKDFNVNVGIDLFMGFLSLSFFLFFGIKTFFHKSEKYY